MRLTISHNTGYAYDHPVTDGLQQLRLRPSNSLLQTVHSWTVGIEGGRVEAQFTDQHGNTVDLISIIPGVTEIKVTCSGDVETHDQSGVAGLHSSPTPLWHFCRQTALTKPGPAMKALLKSFSPHADDDVARLHALSNHILAAVRYNADATHAATTAEEAVKEEHGVCQDHAHVFLSLARELGYPARYVSGYLMMNDRVEQDATHAWAEAHVDGLGWVGFDVSNAISPDGRYVTVATGLDYSEAAPVSGLVVGGTAESMIVSVQVQQ
ncbi:transglutaminase family protein [Hyphobacterium marinum]|uniref:Transglutaminase family protein n=1 Tax=Hyphobacterium marinum TaxID=3116574 RepID=A0ABU7M1J2_9PROT|nr:transglutaminase family protein [Hyphobacterium sp. Y6023]MEE2567689.1 transglutaminase family protein [Hyphobacterium sp. Y6023]